MASSAVHLTQLRQLLAERFPSVVRPDTGVWPTGVPAVDESAGGLPRRALTELVCAAPSAGGHLFITQLLGRSRRESVRVALVDAMDNFDPQSVPANELEHLLWVRCHSVSAAMTAADLLAREASLDLVILDLVYGPLGALRRIPDRTWYRLQRAVEETNLVFLVLTPTRLVASAQLRLQLARPHLLAGQQISRPKLIADLAATLELQRHAARQA
jgi:hypothetical protein